MTTIHMMMMMMINITTIVFVHILSMKYYMY